MKEIRIYYQTKAGASGIADCQTEQLASTLRIIRRLNCKVRSIWHGLIQLYPIDSRIGEGK